MRLPPPPPTPPVPPDPSLPGMPAAPACRRGDHHPDRALADSPNTCDVVGGGVDHRYRVAAGVRHVGFAKQDRCPPVPPGATVTAGGGVKKSRSALTALTTGAALTTDGVSRTRAAETAARRRRPAP